MSSNITVAWQVSGKVMSINWNYDHAAIKQQQKNSFQLCLSTPAFGTQVFLFDIISW